LTLLRRAVRRHPVRTAVFASVVFTVAVVAATLVSQHVNATHARHLEAAESVQSAERRVSEFRTRRERIAELENEVQLLQERLLESYMTDEQVRDLDQHEDDVLTARRDREALFHEVLALLRRAEQRDPGVHGAERVRAALYFEKWRDAITSRDRDGAAYYRELVLASDPDPETRDALSGLFALPVTSEPPGAEVFLFRHADLDDLVAGGEPRSVPVPLTGDPVLTPGAFALRCVADGGGLRTGDVVTSVAGHASTFFFRRTDPKMYDELQKVQARPVRFRDRTYGTNELCQRVNFARR
jgi:hypothetical protein